MCSSTSSNDVTGIFASALKFLYKRIDFWLEVSFRMTRDIELSKKESIKYIRGFSKIFDRSNVPKMQCRVAKR